MGSETAPLLLTDEELTQPNKSAALVSTVTYRSRMVAPMSELELHRLAKAAQSRNHAEGVTGLMVYDRGWIFQQLEGPSVGLARIWASIRADPRHARIEVLGDAPVDSRHFQDWDLKLSVHGAQAGLGQQGMSDKPPELIGRLCRGERPADLPVSSWLPALPGPDPLMVAAEALRLSRAALSDLIATVIVPRLCAARPMPRTQPPSLAGTLAALLIAADATAAFALVKAAAYRYFSLGTLATYLLEPAARDLGDLWNSDDCSDIEVTLGLIRLQAIAREFGIGTPRLTARLPPVVLVVPQPGEAHMLGAALDAEMLWHAGWNPRVDFPPSSPALDALVANTWVDALDLSLSTSFRRGHRLVQVGETIASARLASLNPDMVVVVSGRVFSERPETGDPATSGHHLGADATFGSASQAESAILQALRVRLRALPARAADL